MNDIDKLNDTINRLEKQMRVKNARGKPVLGSRLFPKVWAEQADVKQLIAATKVLLSLLNAKERHPE